MVLALGCTLAAASLVTHAGIGMLGGVLIFAGCIGWFRQVLPHEQHEEVLAPVPVDVRASEIAVIGGS